MTDELEVSIKDIETKLKRLAERIAQPKRFRQTRAILTVPCFSLCLRNQWWPHCRQMKTDGSLLVFGALGLVAFVSLPKWRKTK